MKQCYQKLGRGEKGNHCLAYMEFHLCKMKTLKYALHNSVDALYWTVHLKMIKMLNFILKILPYFFFNCICSTEGMQNWWKESWMSKGMGSRWRATTGNDFKCMAIGFRGIAYTSQRWIKGYRYDDSTVTAHLQPTPLCTQDPLTPCYRNREGPPHRHSHRPGEGKNPSVICKRSFKI